MKITGFDWDNGNWPKCGKHGVSKKEIEEVLLNEINIFPDPYPKETRFKGIGKNNNGRHVFIVFTLKKINQKIKIRPISARYMHDKEIKHYESFKK